MTQQPDQNPTVLDLTAFYYRTAPEFAAAMERRDWDAIARLDMMEAAIVEAEAHAAQFDPETGAPVALALTIEETEEDEDDLLDSLAAFDLLLAA